MDQYKVPVETEDEALSRALERLVAACEEIYCSPETEGEGGFPDDSAVSAGVDGDDMRLTFGMIRLARRSLQTTRPV